MSTQSEYELEQELIKQLQELGYEYVPIANEQELLHNLKLQLEKHNAAALGDTALSDDEFQIVLRSIKKGTPYECSEMLRKDAIGINRNGKIINIKLLNTQPGQWCQNEYQVTNQVSIKGERKNRYDVTLLVNGFPLCQIELKRRGIELNFYILLFHFPQLGHLGSRQVASLSGLAPFTRDSGKFKGRRHIYGGRKNIRNKLYMCVLSAIKRGSFKALYDRLSTKGKPYKVKAVAVMRKIILLANTLISKGEFYRDNMQQSV